MDQTFESFTQWRSMVTETAGLDLTPDYCRERIAALSDDSDASTKAFVATYGAASRDKVVGWFEQALAES